MFTATITPTDADGWYRKVKELIDKQQAAPVWMAEAKVSWSETGTALTGRGRGRSSITGRDISAM